ncbi:MAG TPA: hypothetical protein VNK52_16270 [Hyphomicrobiaceae bacterium]|nr:hypothetical protein [Hyphomicrobiaceae bacterium]
MTSSPKLPLALQIAEVQYALELYREVHPSLVRSRVMTERDRERHDEYMRGVLRTLEWFNANKDVIRAAIADARAAERHPAVKAVADAFPGARVAAVRRTA